MKQEHLHKLNAARACSHQWGVALKQQPRVTDPIRAETKDLIDKWKQSHDMTHDMQSIASLT